jgi:hypothetical protein
MADITKEINSALMKRISKEIDFDAMAKKLKPEFEKSIEEGMLSALKHLDWDEMLYDLFYDKHYKLELQSKFAQTLGLASKPEKGNKK